MSIDNYCISSYRYLIWYLPGAWAGLDTGADDVGERLESGVFLAALRHGQRPLEGAADLGDERRLRLGTVVAGGDGCHQDPGQCRAVLIPNLLTLWQQVVQHKCQNIAVLQTNIQQ